MRITKTPCSALAWLLLFTCGVAPCQAANGWTPPPSWSPSRVEAVRQQVLHALQQVEPTVVDRDKLIGEWRRLSDTSQPEIVLDTLATTAAAIHDDAARLVEVCRQSSSPGSLPEMAWLQDTPLAPLFTKNLRLYAARWLMQEGFYDESLDLIAALAPEEVVDPATLLFCKAVCHHQLVEVEHATTSAQLLLERADELPTRYEQLATLIAEDIKSVEDDSLDHIARRMNDVRRRLDNGQAGNKVVEIENGVIESLDKLLEELEKQRQQQQQQQQQQSGGQSARPMEDSTLPQGMQGPGNVDRRNVGDKSGWGAIDDKAREEALQAIGREFPAHYRDVIEEYFKKIAAEDMDDQ